MRHARMESAGRSWPAARETGGSSGTAGENETGEEKIFHFGSFHVLSAHNPLPSFSTQFFARSLFR